MFSPLTRPTEPPPVPPPADAPTSSDSYLPAPAPASANWRSADWTAYVAPPSSQHGAPGAGPSVSVSAGPQHDDPPPSADWFDAACAGWSGRRHARRAEPGASVSVSGQPQDLPGPAYMRQAVLSIRLIM